VCVHDTNADLKVGCVYVYMCVCVRMCVGERECVCATRKQI